MNMLLQSGEKVSTLSCSTYLKRPQRASVLAGLYNPKVGKSNARTPRQYAVEKVLGEQGLGVICHDSEASGYPAVKTHIDLCLASHMSIY